MPPTYALDLWFEKVFQPRCHGGVFLLRYADDFVCGFGREEEAQRFYTELEERLRKFGLELAEDKTRVIPFSRYRQGETSFVIDEEPGAGKLHAGICAGAVG